MKERPQYANYKKPSWAPPGWLFGPVWTVLYVLIAISYGYTAFLFFTGRIDFLILLPFMLNLIFNLAFIPIQFGLRNFALAAIDILLVLATLAWMLVAIYPYAPWVAYINGPYFAWVCFATVLQLTITFLNRRT